MFWRNDIYVDDAKVTLSKGNSFILVQMKSISKNPYDEPIVMVSTLSTFPRSR